MMGLTRQPNVVEMVCEPSPRGEKSAEKEERREVRGRSSLTTTHDRTQERSIPRVFDGQLTILKGRRYVITGK